MIDDRVILIFFQCERHFLLSVLGYWDAEYCDVTKSFIFLKICSGVTYSFCSWFYTWTGRFNQLQN